MNVAHMGPFRHCIACAAALLFLTSSLVANAQTGNQAGVAAAVRGQVRQVSAVVPGPAVGRVVTSGDKLYLGDRISTGPSAGLQVMLLDQTTLTIGPNSSMTIDEFVYDPQTSKGKVAASILKGTFRFVSGKIAAQNPRDVKIKLPVATIGIRGTTVVGDTTALTARVTLVGAGAANTQGEGPSRIVVAAGQAEIVIHRPGFGVTITRPGAPPTNLQKTPPDVLALWNQLLGRWRTPPAQTPQPGNQRGARAPLGTGESVITQSGTDVVLALDPAKDAALFDLIRGILDRDITQQRPMVREPQSSSPSDTDTSPPLVDDPIN